MRKLFVVLALLATASLATAQGIPVVPAQFTPVATVTSALDTSPALVIKYFQPRSPGSVSAQGAITASVAVEADGNLTFLVAGAAYASFGCPFSGPTTGVLDVSDGDCNLAGEVVDIINSSPITSTQGYFRAALVNALRSDAVSAATTLLADAADSDVETPGGEIVYFDSDGLDDDDVGFYNQGLPLAQIFMSASGLAKNPFNNVNTFLQFGHYVITNAGSVGDTTIYARKASYGGQGLGCTTAGVFDGSEIVRTVAVLPAASATELLLSTYFPYGLVAQDEQIIVRIDSSGNDTSVWSMQSSGFTWPVTVR